MLIYLFTIAPKEEKEQKNTLRQLQRCGKKRVTRVVLINFQTTDRVGKKKKKNNIINNYTIH